MVQIPLNVIRFLQGSIFWIFLSRDLIRLKKTREAYSGITGVHQENFFDIFTVLKFNEVILKFFNFLINQDGVNQWQSIYANPAEWVWSWKLSFESKVCANGNGRSEQNERLIANSFFCDRVNPVPQHNFCGRSK